MKTLHLIIPSLFLALLTSCYHTTDIGPVGPRGPQGPVGPAGAPGENAFVFEWTDVNFTAPDYSLVLDYPNDFDGLSSDVALVYFLWDVYMADNGKEVEVWRALPQSVLTPDGLLIYNYDFTQYDVRLFLNAEFPLDWLGAIDTDNWIVRVVVVPGDFWNGRSTSMPDYQELVATYNLPELAVPGTPVSRREP